MAIPPRLVEDLSCILVRYRYVALLSGYQRPKATSNPRKGAKHDTHGTIPSYPMCLKITVFAPWFQHAPSWLSYLKHHPQPLPANHRNPLASNDNLFHSPPLSFRIGDKQ
ncbi:hypothetical protein VNO77_23278 [Canavalia gladiata]|uniref:Uncharacterized protein n=1 Tax=Canavalia gladiata TaxID=3824 RepID=A0AAN9QBK2_CANGL